MPRLFPAPDSTPAEAMSSATIIPPQALAPSTPKASCPTCGANRPRNLTHPAFARITVACQLYLASVSDHGALPEDVDELRAMIQTTNDQDGGDIAVFAVRAAAQWAVQPFPSTIPTAEVPREALNVLVDATTDSRPRVSASAQSCLARLSQSPLTERPG